MFTLRSTERRTKQQEDYVGNIIDDFDGIKGRMSGDDMGEFIKPIAKEPPREFKHWLLPEAQQTAARSAAPAKPKPGKVLCITCDDFGGWYSNMKAGRPWIPCQCSFRSTTPTYPKPTAMEIIT